MLNFLKITVNMLLAQLADEELEAIRECSRSPRVHNYGGGKQAIWLETMKLRWKLPSSSPVHCSGLFGLHHFQHPFPWLSDVDRSAQALYCYSPFHGHCWLNRTHFHRHCFPPPPLFLIPFLCEDKGGWGSAAMEWVLSGEEDQETGGQSNGIMVDAMIDRKGIWSEIRAQAELLEAAS